MKNVHRMFLGHNGAWGSIPPEMGSTPHSVASDGSPRALAERAKAQIHELMGKVAEEGADADSLANEVTTCATVQVIFPEPYVDPWGTFMEAVAEWAKVLFDASVDWDSEGMMLAAGELDGCIWDIWLPNCNVHLAGGHEISISFSRKGDVAAEYKY